MIEHTVRLHAQPGGFQPTTFSEWIGHQVQVTSLDPVHRHVLRAVENAADGTTSTLTINTYPDADAAPSLTADMSVIMGTPKAQIRAHDADGEHLTTAHLDAPLHEGQSVTVHNQPHVVQEIRYPYRDPDDPEQTEDYQHVTLRAVDALPPVVSLGMAGGMLGLLR
jgi:hypothetical protein